MECKCREEDRENLLNQLRSCAMNIKECKGHCRCAYYIIIVHSKNIIFSTITEVLNVQLETENESENNDYFSVEFTLRNEVGSLVSALEVFHVSL